MTYTIRAMQVVLEEYAEENYRMAVFADRGDDPNKYLILQRAIEADDQDIELGLDGHYVELNDQGNAGYDVCKSAMFDGNHLTIVFLGDCGIEPLEVLVDLSSSQIDRDRVRDYLRSILGDVYADA